MFFDRPLFYEFCGFRIKHIMLHLTKALNAGRYGSVVVEYSLTVSASGVLNPLKGRGVNWLHFAIQF